MIRTIVQVANIQLDPLFLAAAAARRSVVVIIGGSAIIGWRSGIVIFAAAFRRTGARA